MTQEQDMILECLQLLKNTLGTHTESLKGLRKLLEIMDKRLTALEDTQ